MIVALGAVLLACGNYLDEQERGAPEGRAPVSIEATLEAVIDAARTAIVAYNRRMDAHAHPEPVAGEEEG